MNFQNNKIEDNLDKVNLLIKQKDYQTALLILEEIINADEKNAKAFFLIGNIFHLKGEVGKAIKAFNKSLELDPKNTDTAISLSVLYNDIGKYEEAQKVFEKANESVKMENHGLKDPHINKKFSLKHLELAEMYESYTRYEEALIEYNKASALEPDNIQIKIKTSKVLAKKGLVLRAIEELKKIKREYPNNLDTRVALGLMYHSTGNIVDAQNEWQSVLLKDHSHNEAKMYLNLSANVEETRLM